MQLAIKVLISAILITIISEIARRFPFYGGIIAALPLVSLISILWLFVHGETAESLSKFALGVLWGFPATTILLLVLYYCLRLSVPILIAMAISIVGWIVTIYFQDLIFK